MGLSKGFSKTGFGESDYLRCSMENCQKLQNKNFTLSIWTLFEGIDVHKKSSLFVDNLSRLSTKKRHQVIAQIWQIMTYVETICANGTNLNYPSKCKRCCSTVQNWEILIRKDKKWLIKLMSRTFEDRNNPAKKNGTTKSPKSLIFCGHWYP